LVEGEGLRAGERNPAVTRQGFGKQSTSRFGQDRAMEALIHFGVQALVVLLDMALAENRITVLQTGPQLPQQRLGSAALRDLSNGEAFEGASEVNGIDDVLGRKGPDDIAAGLVLGKEALLSQERQRLAHRGARHPQEVRQG